MAKRKAAKRVKRIAKDQYRVKVNVNLTLDDAHSSPSRQFTVFVDANSASEAKKLGEAKVRADLVMRVATYKMPERGTWENLTHWDK